MEPGIELSARRMIVHNIKTIFSAFPSVVGLTSTGPEGLWSVCVFYDGIQFFYHIDVFLLFFIDIDVF